MTSLTSLTIAAARDALKKKQFSALELTDAYLAAMEKARVLNAYIVETPEKAREMAKASDARLAKGEAGALEGIPLGIKDLFATEGVHTQACSHVLDGFKPQYESTVSANLWRDGAVMLGKLNMDEFAMGSSNETSYYGNVINPWKRNNSKRRWCPAVRRAVRPLLLPRISVLRRPPPTRAARSASLRLSPARSASSRPMAAARAGASWPSPPRSTRRARSRATCAMRRSC
jgi:hypothetical protein